MGERRFGDSDTDWLELPIDLQEDNTAISRGYRSGRAGEPRDNPFKPNTPRHRAWFRGYRLGKSRRED